jgi:large subunit ribosomal protein L28
MSRVCEICGKRTTRGNSISRRGLAKRKGGIGKKTTGIARRTFKPNIQRIQVFENGRPRRARVCTACIRSGKIRKAP